MAEEQREKVSNDDVIKTLVDHVLSGQTTHPDHYRTLSDWREQNTTEEEREAAKTDDEREEERRDESGAGGGGDESKPDTTEDDPDSETGRKGPANRAGEDKSPSTAPDTASGRQATRKAGR